MDSQEIDSIKQTRKTETDQSHVSPYKKSYKGYVLLSIPYKNVSISFNIYVLHKNYRNIKLPVCLLES